MTRVNCIPPAFLLDQHLRAEYREITRLWKYAETYDGRPIPETYRLGKGHVRFFIDKGAWVLRRFALLEEELRRRGFKADKSPRAWPNSLRGDWQPTDEARAVLMARLRNRIPKRPKYRSVDVCPDEAVEFYS